MFGIFNLTREETENVQSGKVKEKMNNDEPCYGGFRSRWSYEDCRRRHADLSTVAVCALVCAFFGIIGMASGIILYDFVQSNRELYYPSGALTADDTPMPYHGVHNQSETVQSGVQKTSATSIAEGFALETVTAELSELYRIPRGVMIRLTDPDSDAKLAGFAAGDIIVAVNEVEISDIEGFRAQTELCSENEAITFRIFRKNKYIDVVIVKALA